MRSDRPTKDLPTQKVMHMADHVNDDGRELVAIARPETEFAAETLAVRLRDEGLYAEVVSGNSLGVSLNPTQGNGAAIVLVPADQVDQAHEIMNDAPASENNNTSSDEQPEQPFVPAPAPLLARFSAMVGLLLIFVLIVGGIITTYYWLKSAGGEQVE